MFKLLNIILINIMIISCTTYYNPYKIKLYNEGFTVNKDTFTVIVIYSSIEDVNSSYTNISGINGKYILGFKYLIGDICVIRVVKPDGWDDHNALAIIGHEILHCQGAKHIN